MKKVLGFDVSSSCIGYCLLEVNESTGEIKFKYCNYQLDENALAKGFEIFKGTGKSS